MVVADYFNLNFGMEMFSLFLAGVGRTRLTPLSSLCDTYSQLAWLSTKTVGKEKPKTTKAHVL